MKQSFSEPKKKKKKKKKKTRTCAAFDQKGVSLDLPIHLKSTWGGGELHDLPSSRVPRRRPGVGGRCQVSHEHKKDHVPRQTGPEDGGGEAWILRSTEE